MSLDLPEAKNFKKSATNFYMIGTLCAFLPRMVWITFQGSYEDCLKSLLSFNTNMVHFLPKSFVKQSTDSSDLSSHH